MSDASLTRKKNSHLFLVGFMRSGKSTVAALLAARTGRPCVELDEEIEKRTGRSIVELFSRDGEDKFRQIEKEALARLEQTPPSIVATGGGAFLDVANRQCMRMLGLTVWLDVPLEDARRRAGDGAGRPLWRDDDPVDFRAFFEHRRATYALADCRVLTSQKPPETLANEIFDRFERFF